LLEEEMFDETGSVDDRVKVIFYSIGGVNPTDKIFPVLAMSEHYIMLERFFIKRESWSKSGKNCHSFLNHYEVLEILEKALG